MPIFAYKCLEEDCGHEFEDLQLKSTDEPPAGCEKCDSPKIQKQMGTPACVFAPNDGCGGWAMNAGGTAYVKTQTGGDKVGGARPDEK